MFLPKKRLLTKLALLAAASMASVSLSAGSGADSADGWVLHKQIEGVSFYVKLSNCSPECKTALVKAENKNTYPVSVSYELSVPEAVTIGPSAGTLAALAPQASQSGSCGQAALSILFPEPANELSDLIINAIIIK